MIQKKIRSWLREFSDSVPHRDAVTLAHDVVMLHIAVWPYESETEMTEFDAWLQAHQRLYARGIIRALKRHRKWSEVKRLLISNRDIATEEYHPYLIRVIRKYG